MADRRLWFKRRRYGWGWVPATWEGWAVLAVYVAVVLAAGQLVERADWWGVGAWVTQVVATVALVVIGFKKGPKPRWRWGKKPDDHPQEDW